ncbi:hypothetical protein KL921_002258 [Ogataea angusta]|uniref:Nba1p n=1 Tax=Pichia angusta TaxID=870730 RepID=A0ABQ7RZS2_PICAN|nr:hypothetical protein KL921_002258 [Ogataea angusta]KAG7818572.1 hypothetical protein KL909_004962 [Ogataea angusta]KAG7830665.1 hypothetical protein KL920_001256 [Ogataea angusta]KAG7834881.1 hypothetical protein KL943_002196 [Ogataea angusta]KAG7840696.1 hypothetical protein KL942_002647 [Ogataea angusta]
MSERSSVYSEMPMQKLTVTNPDLDAISLRTPEKKQLQRDDSPHSSSSHHSSSPAIAKHTFTEQWNKRVSNISNAPGNRSSMMSEYSGIVQHVDIDTVKYVVDKDSDTSTTVPSERLSEVKKISGSKIQHSSGARDLTGFLKDTSPVIEEDDKESIRKPQVIPVTRPCELISDGFPRVPDKEQYTQLNLTIPARSPRRPLSGGFQPIDKITNKPGRPSMDSSSSGRSSGRASGKFDDIMKEFEDLRSEIEAEADQEQNSLKFGIPPFNVHKYSPSQATSVRTGAESFHTARSISESEDDIEKEDTEQLRKVNSGSTVSEESIFDQTAREQKLDGTEGIPEDEYEDVEDPEDKPVPQASTKMKKRAKRPKSRIKSFSYDTLARLLNATDGIVIGQEFADLDIPADEKYLIEQVVDSLSRLTANMMLNPNHYKQGCERLERVLGALEGFD